MPSSEMRQYSVTARLQHYHANAPETRVMENYEACNRKKLLEILSQDTVIGYTEDGTQVPDVDKHVLKSCAALLGIPVSPWGDRDLMHLYAVPGVPALNDVPPELLHTTLTDGAQILARFIEERGVAYMGVNNSMGSYGLHKRGFMSVPWPHTHYFTIPDPDGNTSSKLRGRRAEFDWDDNGISRAVATRFAPDIQHLASSYWGDACVAPDKLGYTVTFPGFSPQHLHETGFIPCFFHHLSLLNHAAMKGIYHATYGIDLDMLIEHNIVLRNGCTSIKEYNESVDQNREQFATMRPPDRQDPWFEEATRFRALGEDRLRLGGGWATAIEFHPDGATLANSFGFVRGHNGPVQALGYELIRKPEFPSKMEQEELEEYYAQMKLSLGK